MNFSHDSGDDLWLLGLGEGSKASQQDLSTYQQRTPSPRRNTVPSPLYNIPIREDENRQIPQSFGFSPIADERVDYCSTVATTSQQHSSSDDVVVNGIDLNCVDRPTTSSALSFADSDGVEIVPAIQSSVDDSPDMGYRQVQPQTSTPRLPCRPANTRPNDRPNGVVQLQQRIKPTFTNVRSQELRPSVSCEIQPGELLD